MKAGVDYPTDLFEFDWFLPDEPACLRYLERLRWRDGFACAKCGIAAEAWRMSRRLLLCTSCRSQTSVIVGTIFEGTRKPLKLWSIAAWEMFYRLLEQTVQTVHTPTHALFFGAGRGERTGMRPA